MAGQRILRTVRDIGSLPLAPIRQSDASRLRDAEVQAGFLAASLRDRAKPDDNAWYLAQWQAEGRVVIEKSAHRHTWIASITGSCTILCSGAGFARLAKDASERGTATRSQRGRVSAE